jgi:1-acyl-sn-glycerol-3-phosphate acyltransferase
VSPALGVFLRATFGPLLAALYRTRVIGAENVPDGPAILCGNHISNMDPVLLWIVAPRPVRFMAKAEAWDNKLMAWGLPRVWAFPVKRGEPDRRAITVASEVLRDGHLLGVFPEGTRNTDGTAEAQDGAAFLALRNGVPIVPLGVYGTDRIKPAGARLPRFPRVVISYGEPIRPEEFTQGGRKERMEAMTAEVMRGIARQLEEAAGA